MDYIATTFPDCSIMLHIQLNNHPSIAHNKEKGMPNNHASIAETDHHIQV
jgi:hypothetical protein